MKKSVLVLLSSIAALAIAVGLAVCFVGYQFAHSRPSEAGSEVVYEVKPGLGFNAMAQEFEQKGLVRNARFFTIYARMIGERNKVKAGEYLLRTDMMPKEVLNVITSGKSIERAFTVSEGLNLWDIADLYAHDGFGKREDFWRLTHDKAFIKNLLGEEHDSLEGYLFPETYMLTKFTDAKTLITNMVKRFLYVYNDVISQSQIKGLSRHEIVTLASIIEKETGAPEERPLISSIFHNRLEKHMRLQTDPTVLYGKAEKLGKMEISITREDLTLPTAYNTYVIPALPPGPISNPGREALLAAIKPATSPYLFFVSQNNGTHIFTSDYQSHLKAVQKYQLDPKAREGKSWRDLKNRKDVPAKDQPAHSAN